MTFLKGQVNNPNGRPPNSPILTPLVRQYMDLTDSEFALEGKRTDLRQKDQIAMAIVREIKKGSSHQLATVWERTDGKVKTEVDVSSGGEPLAHLVIVTTDGADKS